MINFFLQDFADLAKLVRPINEYLLGISHKTEQGWENNMLREQTHIITCGEAQQVKERGVSSSSPSEQKES